MGVIGLLTFLKKKPILFVRGDLRDTQLVIDGHLLLGRLFELLIKQEGHKKEDLYGGDMVAYGQLVRQFFVNLKLCNIQPIIVFGGSAVGKQLPADKITLKKDIVYEKSRRRFDYVRNIGEPTSSSGAPRSMAPNLTITPQTIYHVFGSLVRQMNIRQVQTPYDATAILVALANFLKCPVLTTDHNLLLHNIEEGFILVDELANKEPTSCRGMPCRILHQQRFLKFFPGLMASTMPLLGIFMGRDCESAYRYAKQCDRVAKIDHQGELAHRKDEFVHRKLLRMLEWLRHKTPWQAMVRFPESGPWHPRKSDIIENLLRQYSVQIYDNLMVELNQVYPPEEHETFTVYPWLYLKRLTERATLEASIVFDIAFRNPSHNQHPTIENFTLASSSQLKYRPLSVCIALLRSNGSNPDNDGLSPFEYWDRVNQIYDKRLIYPRKMLNRFGPLTHLNIYTMITMDVHDKRALLLETFHSSPRELDRLVGAFMEIISEGWAKQASLLMMLVKYIGVETQLGPSRQLYQALFLTLLYHGCLNRDTKLVGLTQDRPALTRLVSLIDSLAIDTGARRIQETLYVETMHLISQLQASIQSYELLNSLLDTPVESLKLEQYLNFIFIYNISRAKYDINGVLGAPEYRPLLGCLESVSETLVENQL